MYSKKTICASATIVLLLITAGCLFLGSWLFYLDYKHWTDNIPDTYNKNNVPTLKESEANSAKDDEFEKIVNRVNQTNKTVDKEIVTMSDLDEICENPKLAKTTDTTGLFGCIAQMKNLLKNKLDDDALSKTFDEYCEMRPIYCGKCYVVNRKDVAEQPRTRNGGTLKMFGFGRQINVENHSMIDEETMKMCNGVEMDKIIEKAVLIKCINNLNVFRDTLHDDVQLYKSFYENCEVRPLFCGTCYKIYAKENKGKIFFSYL